MISRNLPLSCCLFFTFLSGAAVAQNSLLIRQEVYSPATNSDNHAKGDANFLKVDIYSEGNQAKGLTQISNDEVRGNRRVKFVAVTVKSNGNKPQVSWQVTEEEEVSHYSIERSYNGSFFEEGGKVPFKRVTLTFNTYTFLDEGVGAEEEVYYRVRQVDSSGRYMYSQIVSIKLHQSSALQLIPNPAYDRTSVQVESNKVQTGWLQLVDPSGAVVYKQAITLKKGSNKLMLDGLQQFGNGAYYVQVVLPGGTLYKKLLLQ